MTTFIVAPVSARSGGTLVSSALALLLAEKPTSILFVRASTVPISKSEQSMLKGALAGSSLKFVETKAKASPSDIASAVKSNPERSAIIEGLSGDWEYNLRLAEETDGWVVLLCGPNDDFMGAIEKCGSRVGGVILNRVPQYRRMEARLRVSEALREKGIPLLGVLPEDRELLSPTLEEVRVHLKGDYVGAEQKGDILIGNFLIGGAILDWAPFYFGSREKVGVIVRGDRPDIQLAALQSDTVRALIISKGVPPIEYVLYEADTRSIPLVVVEGDTVQVADRIGGLELGVALHPEKIARMKSLIAENADVTEMERMLEVPVTG